MSPDTTPEQSPRDLALAGARLAIAKKAEDVLLLDLRELTSVCDYFLIATGESPPQVKAIAESVEDGLREQGERPWQVEGKENKQWIILDYVDFVVHVFSRTARETYLLERLWGDAPQEVVDGGTGSS